MPKENASILQTIFLNIIHHAIEPFSRIGCVEHDATGTHSMIQVVIHFRRILLITTTQLISTKVNVVGKIDLQAILFAQHIGKIGNHLFASLLLASNRDTYDLHITPSNKF